MTSATQVPGVALADGAQIPQLGIGVFEIPPRDTVAALHHAFETGYRHVDTAAAYGNEAEVGEAVRTSGLDRSELYVTTKCWNADHGHDEAKAAFRASCGRLGIDYVDLYLIHWPVPARDRYVETWRALVELQQEGRVRSVGVSNFQPDHLARIVDETGVTPVINQIELHPYLQQPDLRREHTDRGIVTQAWSPIAKGAVLDDPVLQEIAQGHGKTPGQVTLRWHVQLGNVVFPKSGAPERIDENFAIFDFELSGEDMAAIEALDRGERTGPDPDTFNLT